MTNQTDPVIGSVIHVNPLGQYMLELTKELSLSKHQKITRNELAAFYLLVVMIENRQDEKESINYTFDALELADMLGINPNKGRGTIVANLYRRLQRNIIFIPHPETLEKDGDISFESYNYLSAVKYDARTKRISLRLEPEVNQLLFSYKKNGSFVAWDNIRELSMKGKNTLQMFILLYGLNSCGIHTISIEDLRDFLGLKDKYKQTIILMQKVVRPAEKDIRSLPDFKEFSISTNAKPQQHIKTSLLFFSFNQKNVSQEVDLSLNQDILSTLSSENMDLVSKLPDRRRSITFDALRAGVSQDYIPVFSNYKGDDKLLRAELTNALDYCRKRNKKDPDECGRIIISSIKNGWVRNNDKYKQKIYESEQKENLKKRRKATIEDISYEDETAALKLQLKRIDRWLSSISDQQLFDFAKENYEQLNSLMSSREFDINALLKRDKRRLEYRTSKKFILARLLDGSFTLDFPEQLSL